jgi:hypothetical protein
MCIATSVALVPNTFATSSIWYFTTHL